MTEQGLVKHLDKTSPFHSFTGLYIQRYNTLPHSLCKTVITQGGCYRLREHYSSIKKTMLRTRQIQNVNKRTLKIYENKKDRADVQNVSTKVHEQRRDRLPKKTTTSTVIGFVTVWKALTMYVVLR